MKVKKPAAKKRKAPLAQLKPKLDKTSVSFQLDVKTQGLDCILGAAYLLTDRAFALLEGDRAKKVTVRLTPKKAGGRSELEALGKTFALELETQKVRWAIAKNNLPIREYITEQAVLLANAVPAAAPAAGETSEELTDEQRQEIEKLISEVEAEIKTMNEKKAAVADPKNLKASWEEKQESKVQEKA